MSDEKVDGTFGSVGVLSTPVAYWPPEDEDGNVVMPAEITDVERRALPACREGWHFPAEDSRCQVCARELTEADEPYRIEIPPGALPGIMRVLAEGSRQIAAGTRTEATIDDLAITASAMARLLAQQKTRAALSNRASGGDDPNP